MSASDDDAVGEEDGYSVADDHDDQEDVDDGDGDEDLIVWTSRSHGSMCFPRSPALSQDLKMNSECRHETTHSRSLPTHRWTQAGALSLPSQHSLKSFRTCGLMQARGLSHPGA